VVSTWPSGKPSSRNWTPAMPVASLAVAVTVVEPVTVPAAGAVRLTVGSVQAGWTAPDRTVTVSPATRTFTSVTLLVSSFSTR
jgi:hypothetical protein